MKGNIAEGFRAMDEERIRPRNGKIASFLPSIHHGRLELGGRVSLEGELFHASSICAVALTSLIHKL